MLDREFIVPVVIGLFIAVGLHVYFFAEAPQWGWLAGDARADAFRLDLKDSPSRDDGETPPRPELELGRDRKVVRSSVAWIAYDDVRELLAKPNIVAQPAVQVSAEPVPRATPIVDATPPLLALPPVDPAPPSGSLAELAELALPSPPIPGLQAPLKAQPELNELGDVTLVHPAPQVQFGPLPSPVEAQMKPHARDDQRVAETKSGGSPAPPTEAAPNPQPENARPTSANRSDREAPPAVLRVPMFGSVRGGVVVAEGLEVRTVTPRPGIASANFSQVREARFAITFDMAGDVIDTRMLQSTLYDDIDAVIEMAIYKWKASGEKLKDAPHTIVVTFYQ